VAGIPGLPDPTGRVAQVSGGSSGIGLAMARALAGAASA
jgi:NAD(P)-dependent dehydrogenase (short-subunit alcohol dehydrogenase family)